jgi:hypothetical protein
MVAVGRSSAGGQGGGRRVGGLGGALLYLLYSRGGGQVGWCVWETMCC